MPPLCLLTSHILFNVLPSMERNAQWLRRGVVTVVVLALAGQTVLSSIGRGAQIAYMRAVKGTENWADLPMAISAYLQPHIGTGDTIFVFDYQPIVYFLSKAKVPSKYCFPLFILDDHFARVAGIVPQEQIDAILETHPRYIVMRNPPDRRISTLDRFERTLNEQYRVDTLFSGVALGRWATLENVEVKVFELE